MHMPPTTSHICAEEQEQGTSAVRHVSTLTRSHGQFPTPHRDDDNDTLLQTLIVFTPTALSFGSGHRFTTPDCWKIETSREKIISHWEYHSCPPSHSFIISKTGRNHQMSGLYTLHPHQFLVRLFSYERGIRP